LAKEQISIAAGNKLSFTQDDVEWRGHAIECRIYAEDPFNGFLPDTGKITYLREPAGKGVRIDSGIENNSEISIYFDPMLSKLIAWGKNREEALNRMDRALQDYKITGLRTIIPFLIAVMRNPVFRDEYFDTGFIQNAFDFELLEKMRDNYYDYIATIAAFSYRNHKNGDSNNVTKAKTNGKHSISRWKQQCLQNR
jgi:acetyl/propionyl-CoA carboxylase alpha subunit